MTAQAMSQVVNLKRPSDSRDSVKKTQTEEIVIALCGPIGSPIKQVGQEISEVLHHEYGYETEIIRLSEFLTRKSTEIFDFTVDDSSEFKRINTLIGLGNKFRDQYGERILAELAIHHIIFDRIKSIAEKASPQSRRKCYIIDSIKNHQELEILRLVYSEILYFVGVFSSPEQRAQNLEATGMTTAEVYTLIDRDSGEEIAYGQKVSDTFPKADFFIRAEDNAIDDIRKKVTRFVSLLFEGGVVTPHRNEAAMYAAWSAASNSACLSRQVGAAISDAQGHVLSVGWNDVPKSGGGLYLSDDSKDKRCWNSGEKCYNDYEKSELAKLIAGELITSGLVDKAKKAELIESIKNNGRLKGLIEFSRAVHAEMHAIINAGYVSGSKIVGASLFCTTYPCHSCARHIIAAGIKEIFYIEPYRKSLAIKLHGDALTEHSSDLKKVRVLAYEGVAPRRFLELFEMGSTKRKESGKIVKIKKIRAKASTRKIARGFI